MLFIDTVLAGLFFADDGRCESYTTRDKCLLTKSLDQLDTLCSWTEQDGTEVCMFNQSIGQSFYSLLVQTTIISIITVFFDMAFYYMLKKVKNLAEVTYTAASVSLITIHSHLTVHRPLSVVFI